MISDYPKRVLLWCRVILWVLQRTWLFFGLFWVVVYRHPAAIGLQTIQN